MKGQQTTRTKSRTNRSIDEAIRILWLVIDEARMNLEDEMTTPEEKRRWAKNLCDSIGVLNKILANRDDPTLEDESLGSLLDKVPRALRKHRTQGVQKWRSTRFSKG